MKQRRILHTISILGIIVFGVLALATSTGHGPREVWVGDFGLLLLPRSHTYAKIIGYQGSVTDIELPSHLIGRPIISVAEGALENRGLRSVIIPGSIASIGARAFAGNLLTCVVFSHGIEIIDQEAFAENQLESVTLPDSISWIGRGAFAGNPLTHVTLPNTAIHIGDLAFGAAEVVFPDGTPAVGKEGDFRWNRRDQALIITGFSGSDTDIEIPRLIQGKTVTEIGGRAFEGRNLTSVIIPPDIRRIEFHAFAENPLVSITIGQDVRIWEGRPSAGDAFSSFVSFYRSQEFAAGTYTRNEGRWSVELR
jgi:hypothetical protein